MAWAAEQFVVAQHPHHLISLPPPPALPEHVNNHHRCSNYLSCHGNPCHHQHPPGPSAADNHQSFSAGHPTFGPGQPFQFGPYQLGKGHPQLQMGYRAAKRYGFILP